MPNEEKDQQSEKKSNQIGIWLAFGAGIGILLGIAFDNIAIGITMGAALGLVFGAAFSQQNKKS